MRSHSESAWINTWFLHVEGIGWNLMYLHQIRNRTGGGFYIFLYIIL